MAQTPFNRYRNKPPMAEMNIVPLVDVMLVLLVIFIVTTPLLTHAVKIELPKASAQANVGKAAHIALDIRQNGDLLWAGAPVSMAELAQRLATESAKQPQPEVHIRADRHVYYENVAKVMALVSRAGMVKIGFVSEPEAGL